MTASEQKSMVTGNCGPEAAKRVLVFTATYNELGNIDVLIERIFATGIDLEILVVDDNSPDGTGRHLDELASIQPRLRVVHRPCKMGLGSAHQLAMVYAVQNGYDHLVTMDADLSHDPAEIPALLAKLADVDFVIGSRYAPGGSSDYDGYRRFLSVSANTLARRFLGIPTHEFTTSFRAFRVNMLRDRRCAKLKGGGYSYFMETVYRLHRAGFRMAEVPIQFRDRHFGSSKIPRFEIFSGVAKLLRLTLSRLAGRGSISATNIEDNCQGCGSPFLMEYHARKDDASINGKADAYRCSSMAHGSKPQVALCLRCGLMQVPAKQQPKNLADIYADVEDELYMENALARQITFARLIHRISPWLGKPGTLVEVGSYCGLFLAEAIKRGWSVTGVEPSRWASNFARTSLNIPIHQGSLATVSKELQPPYDAVMSWDVMEHLDHPFDMLLQSNRLLRQGGTLSFCTLDAANWFPRLLGGRWPWLMDMHLYYFTRPLLRRWLTNAGFEIIYMGDYRHYATLSYLALKAATLLPRPLQGLAASLAEVLPTKLAVPVSFGDIVLIVARKIHDSELVDGSLPDQD
ncbi:hypothetical protein CU669_10910 [Paramagnetospirillum kuznetsovii]|uniref:Glycosyltransferase 2-like domain-containing protein n=1 Tax=Paramagnetospirillum kuznetsovii TaxID=2053833 RepID=A0A364NXI2_9PROT|nr:glycosyltransferase [Paramagnetospirillum kuznetsovii]RAU21809.1 hypothetical protein CU669_10910 [Paramagnetospirillum kuznetsovii]